MFEDAAEPGATTEIKPPTLEESLKEVNTLLEIALDNRFQEALDACEKWAHVSLYHALGKATLGFLKGVLTLEKKETDEAMEDLKGLIEVYISKRRNINPLSKLVWKPNYNTFTDGKISLNLIQANFSNFGKNSLISLIFLHFSLIFQRKSMPSLCMLKHY